jgi:hypothetical protein
MALLLTQIRIYVVAVQCSFSCATDIYWKFIIFM